MRIGVVGGGVVGRATAKSFAEFCEVRMYDKVPERSTHSIGETLQCDIVFVCLPTPMRNFSAVEEFFATAPKAVYALKSTVPIGTTTRMALRYKHHVVHVPEFLTARCAEFDANTPVRNIIGYPGEQSAACPVAGLLQQRFPHVPIVRMASKESEAVKLMTNAFFAVKVAFWNEMRQLADFDDMRWELMLNAILGGGRIHPSHTMVPGPDGKRGFGGACLPKDLVALIDSFAERTLDATVCRAAFHRNCNDRSEP